MQTKPAFLGEIGKGIAKPNEKIIGDDYRLIEYNIIDEGQRRKAN